MNTMYSRLKATAGRHGDQPAVQYGEETLSYRTILGTTDDLARALPVAGVASGSRVGVMLPNGPAFVCAFFGVLATGAMVVPINPSLKPQEVGAILEDGRVSAIVTTSDLLENCQRSLQAASLVTAATIVLDDVGRVIEGSRAGLGPAGSPGPAVKPEDPALCLYSSGSTGRAKRVERSHGNLLYEIDRLVSGLALGPGDRVLGVAPFSHVNGLMRSLVASLLSGATLVPVLQFERRAVATAIEKFQITGFIGVPFMFAMLAESRWPKPVDFSSLRYCFSSSAPLRSETSARFRERYGIYVRQLYGTTETGTIALNQSAEVGDSLDSVGTALPGIEVDILSDDRRLLGEGEIGDIGIKSPAAARGYAGRPEETQKSFRDGYFFPGDVGRKDASGRISLLGRKSLFINRGGYKVNPREIEELLEQHPKVAEAAVTGLETPYGDEKIRAVVVVREPCEEAELVEFCRRQVADFKVPSVVEFREELPKSSTGKLLRKAL